MAIYKKSSKCFTPPTGGEITILKLSYVWKMSPDRTRRHRDVHPWKLLITKVRATIEAIVEALEVHRPVKEAMSK